MIPCTIYHNIKTSLVLISLDNSKSAYWYLDEDMKDSQEQPEVNS